MSSDQYDLSEYFYQKIHWAYFMSSSKHIAHVGGPILEVLGRCRHSGEYVYEDNINSLRFIQAICKHWPIDNCGIMVN